jgi:16S rRNA (uracil1498-N3)-methyltransferase
MALRRFYLEASDLDEHEIVIRADLFHHIREVCRFGVGDRFEILPGDGSARLVEVIRVGARELWLRSIAKRQLPPLPKPLLTLALSIPKLPKVDWIVEKCVELGVYEIRPFVSDFSFLRKPSEISEGRLQRWHKLIQSATQQSGRGELMRIHPAVTLEALLEAFNQNPGAAGLFPYEGEARLGLRDAINAVKAASPESLWVFVGSEGGFSRREVDLFARHGMSPVSMGEQVLRVETACLALMSVIKYETGALA